MKQWIILFLSCATLASVHAERGVAGETATFVQEKEGPASRETVPRTVSSGMDACSPLGEEAVIEKVWSKTFTVTVSESQGKAIEEIVTTLGTSSVLALGFKKAHLKSLGKQLKGIGSLNFLGYIFSHSDLKMYMSAIQRSSFKWNGFVDGLKDGFEQDSKSGKLSEELAGFAKLVGGDYEKLSLDAQKKDWEGFVTSLVASSRACHQLN